MWGVAGRARRARPSERERVAVGVGVRQRTHTHTCDNRCFGQKHVLCVVGAKQGCVKTTKLHLSPRVVDATSLPFIHSPTGTSMRVCLHASPPKKRCYFSAAKRLAGRLGRGECVKGGGGGGRCWGEGEKTRASLGGLGTRKIVCVYAVGERKKKVEENKGGKCKGCLVGGWTKKQGEKNSHARATITRPQSWRPLSGRPPRGLTSRQPRAERQSHPTARTRPPPPRPPPRQQPHPRACPPPGLRRGARPG